MVDFFKRAIELWILLKLLNRCKGKAQITTFKVHSSDNYSTAKISKV